VKHLPLDGCSGEHEGSSKYMLTDLPPVCPVCFRQAADHADEYEHNNVRYTLEKCDQCGLYFWWPMIFPEAGYYEEHESYITRHLNMNQIQGNHWKFLKKYKDHPGTLLDVGCANGSFVKKAQEYGFDVYGIDIDGASIKASKDRGLTNTFCMEVEEFFAYSFANHLRFDYITVFEVIEHQARPVEFMKLVAKMLKPGGVVYGSVPNRNRLSWLLREKGKSYEDVDYPPHHFTLWDPNSLKKYFEAIGFTGEYFIIDEWKRYNVIINKTGIYELMKKMKRGLLGLEKVELPLEGNFPVVSREFKVLSFVRDLYDISVSSIFLPYYFLAFLTNRGVRIVFDVRETG
jgi:SAM-dependent methyltransferase